MEWTSLAVLAAVVAILGFLWRMSADVRAMHRDMARDLRALAERVAAVEAKVSTALGLMRRANGEDSAPAERSTSPPRPETVGQAR